MGARELLIELAVAGITLERHGDALTVRPVAKLTDEWRHRIRAAKPELLEYMREATVTAAALIDAAMAACDHWKDDDDASAQMRRECMEVPTHLWPDLLAHLKKTYGAKPMKESGSC